MSTRPNWQMAAGESLVSLATHNARERVRVFYDALGHEPSCTLLDLLDPGIVWEFCAPDTVPFAGLYTGREGVARFLEKLAIALDPPRFDMDELIASRERIVAVGALRGTPRNGGGPVAIPTVHTWELPEGRILRFRGVLDPAAAHAAFGVPIAKAS